MTWSYSGDPRLNMLDAVHFHLGDTNPASPVATDQECFYALGQTGDNPLLAAALLADAKALTFVGTVRRRRLGSTDIWYEDQAARWTTLAASLRLQASIASVTGIYAGGVSVADKAAQDGDTDRVRPFARRGLHSDRSTDTPAAWERDA